MSASYKYLYCSVCNLGNLFSTVLLLSDFTALQKDFKTNMKNLYLIFVVLSSFLVWGGEL